MSAEKPKDGCGFKRKYANEEQVKVAAKALNMAHHYCRDCKAYHLGPAGKSGRMQHVARGIQ